MLHLMTMELRFCTHFDIFSHLVYRVGMDSGGPAQHVLIVNFFYDNAFLYLTQFSYTLYVNALS